MTEIERKVCGTCNRVFTSAKDFYANTSRWRVCTQKNLWFNCACGSTMVLPKGKFSWYSPSKTMSSRAAGLFNMLSSFGELPHIPTTVMEMQLFLQKDDVEVSDMAKKIRSDPFIAAEIMALANNMKSNRDPHDRRRIDSVEHAIMYAGKKTVSDLILTIGLSALPNSCHTFRTDVFWKESFLTGDISEVIAEQVSYRLSRDELYIAASLCNIGKFVQSFFLPDTLDRLEGFVANPKTQCDWRTAEKSLGSPDHCIMGEIGAALWGLPLYVIEAASAHHAVKTDGHHHRAKKETSTFQIIALANQMTHWVLLRPRRMDMILLENLCAFFDFSKKDLDALGEKLSRRFHLAA